METRPGPCGFVIFGASGDLAGRKLLPGLFSLYKRGLLKDFFVLGCGRKKLSDDDFRAHASLSLKNHCSAAVPDEDFLRRLSYVSGDYAAPALHAAIAEKARALDARFGACGNLVFYMATPPLLFRDIAAGLKTSPLSVTKPGGPFVRLVVEKPFGKNREDALALDEELKTFLREDQIYRIDHYLGKETVQNIALLRFANTLFEPLWNAEHIDNVQLTVAETLGIEKRAGFFENTGTMLDMFQNHMLRLLSLITMERPAVLDAEGLRTERLNMYRVLSAMKPRDIGLNVVRGQYAPATGVKGYLEEEGVARDSTVETFVAARLLINNHRWHGVPFYLRTGKRLAEQSSRVVITFKRLGRSIFPMYAPGNIEPNSLVLDIQPKEKVSIAIQTKLPGPRFCLTTKLLSLDYGAAGLDAPDAYERLLLDCVTGDQMLFVRHDNMSAAWDWVTPILREWRENPSSNPLHAYAPGTWGPTAADELLRRDGREWYVHPADGAPSA